MAFTLPLGASAPEFSLPGVDGKIHELADFAKCRLLVIAFWCNHCPYVIGSEDRVIRFCLEYAPHNVGFVMINSNEQVTHPTDSLEHMIIRAREKNFPFLYLRDESQAVARAYGALRTPHFYVFDEQRKLQYTGRFDDNPRNPGSQKTSEMKDAVDNLLAGRPPQTPLSNPIGCNVKWLGQDRHWMPPEACDLV